MQNESTKKIETVAVIGCGRPAEGKIGWAQGHANALGLREAFPQARLCGVDINPDNLAAFGEAFQLPEENLFASTDELYEAVTPDIVAIATWPGLHCRQVHEAAEKEVRGIFCEKPVGLDASEVDQMESVCAKHGVKLAVAHQRRHLASFQTARRLIAEGRFGEKIVLHARVGDDWDMMSWTVHWFDMANYLLNAHPRWVLAGVHHGGERRYGHAVETASIVFAEYSEERQAVFATGPNPLIDSGIMIEGERVVGRMREDGLYLYGDEAVEKVPFPEAGHTMAEAYGDAFRELGGAVSTGAPMLCGIENTAMATRMAFAAHESALYQRKVFLPSSVQYAPLEILQHPPRYGREKLKLTLIADPHYRDPSTGRTTRDGVAGALDHEVHVVPVDEREVTEADFEGCGALLLCHTALQSSEATRRIVGDWIFGGKPTVIVHCGIGAWPDWPELRAAIGRYWIWPESFFPGDAGQTPSGHPLIPCSIENRVPGKLATGWSEAWLPSDEVYRDLAEGEEIDLLAVTRLEDGAQPIAWQNQHRPNITAWLPGHRPDIWELPTMRQGLQAVLDLARKASR